VQRATRQGREEFRVASHDVIGIRETSPIRDPDKRWVSATGKVQPRDSQPRSGAECHGSIIIIVAMLQ
jgi:hypothetical protein